MSVLFRLKRLFSRSRPKPPNPAKPKLPKNPLFRPRLVKGEPKGRVVFTAFGKGGFGGIGKVRPSDFYDAFCGRLLESGIESYFVTDQAGLDAALVPGTCVVHVFNEETTINPHVPTITIPKGVVVFNSLHQADTLGSKRKSHLVLSAAGVLMPPLVDDTHAPVFSIAERGTSEEAWILADGALDPARHNTRFIDTTVDFEGQRYFTTVRTMSVRGRIIHAYVRARPDTGSASVHAYDTPLNPTLLAMLQDQMVVLRQGELAAIVQKVAEVFGPGFYSCDLLIERETRQIYLCEPGWKLQDNTYPDVLMPIRAELPFHEIMLSGAYTSHAADAFLAECAALGAFQK